MIEDLKEFLLEALKMGALMAFIMFCGVIGAIAAILMIRLILGPLG